LQSLGEVAWADELSAGEVGNSAGKFEDAVKGSGRKG